MRVYALVGDSGTGKSYNSVRIAAKYKLGYIIDDGLLIHKNKIIEGTSAKKEPTLVAAVKKAIFQNDADCKAMKNALARCEISGILILGTSVKMVEKIRTRLDLPEFVRIIQIEEVCTEEEISKAKLTRQTQGKHVIPVPVMEIRKTFSGYFLDPLRVFRKTAKTDTTEDKSIVRPTYSYLGDFVINDTVLYSIATYEAKRCDGVDKIPRVSLLKEHSKLIFNIDVVLCYGTDIPKTTQQIITTVKNSVENYTSIYIDYINLNVKGLTVEDLQ